MRRPARQLSYGAEPECSLSDLTNTFCLAEEHLTCHPTLANEHRKCGTLEKSSRIVNGARDRVIERRKRFPLWRRCRWSACRVPAHLF